MWRLGRSSIYAYCKPTDLRKGFEGLCAQVREELGKEPLSGSLGNYAALWKFTEHESLYLKRSELELFLEGSHLVPSNWL